MYSPEVTAIDQAAIVLHNDFPEESKRLFITAGKMQQKLLAKSPYIPNAYSTVIPERRYFDAQFCWALGHIGILYQMIRWFKLREPLTELILETQGHIANQFFLEALSPHITIIKQLPESMKKEAVYNAVYFGCTDGVHHIHDFMKVAEKECKGINLLKPYNLEREFGGHFNFHTAYDIKRPFVAIQARNMAYDSQRNVTMEQIEEALEKYPGYDVVSTGLDPHPIEQKYKSVRSMPDPALASFLLSSSCDQFIGSDSGAWTIPWAYGRPVELINDKSKAWIYE